MVNTHTPRWATHKWEDKSQLQRFPPRSEGSETHIGLLSQEVLHWEDESPRTSGFESQCSSYMGELEDCRKETPLLKEHTKSHML